MTDRQQKYKQNRLLGMSKKNAAISAGYSKNTAVAVKNNIEKRLNMTFEDHFQQIGLTDKMISKRIEDGLNATKPISAIVYGKNADEKTTDFIDVPDWSARHKFMELLLKLTNKIDNKPIVDQSTHINFTNILSTTNENELRNIIDRCRVNGISGNVPLVSANR